MMHNKRHVYSFVIPIPEDPMQDAEKFASDIVRRIEDIDSVVRVVEYTVPGGIALAVWAVLSTEDGRSTLDVLDEIAKDRWPGSFADFLYTADNASISETLDLIREYLAEDPREEAEE